MTEPIAPLTPEDCDLRDFPFMPLDVVRLRDSDLAATETAEVFRAAVMLWCASWHQLPAASLPDDDRVLSNLAGYGRVVKEWQKEREGALRGWVKCSDDRLYHPVVAEKAVEAWRGKLERQWRTEVARIKKHAQRHNIPAVYLELEEWLSSGRPQGHPLTVPKDTPEVSPGQDGNVLALSSGKTPPIERDRDRDSGQGQGQIEEKRDTSAEPTLPRCQPEEVVTAYHDALPELPRVRLMTDKRRKAIGSFWRFVLTSKRTDGTRRAHTADEAMAWIRDYFGRARENDFLMGRTPRGAEHANWQCDLDFLLTDRGKTHVIEKTREAA